MKNRYKFKVYIDCFNHTYDVLRLDYNEGVVEVGDFDGEPWRFYFDDVKIMQFTGRKDKHKEEIYEGYHVKYDEDKEGVVEWCENYGMHIISNYEHLEEVRLIDIAGYKLEITRRY